MGFLFNRLRSAAALVRALIRDPVLHELDVPTSVGLGFLFIQIRRGRDGTDYAVVKEKGGDATVWCAISAEQARKVAEFLTEHLPAENGEGSGVSLRKER